MQQIITYRGIDLLDKILEFAEMTPETNLWTLDAIQENQPRFVRLRQIDSLINAFFQKPKTDNFVDKVKNIFSNNKKETIYTILSGEFLKEQNPTDYFELYELIKSTVKAKERFEREEREMHSGQLVMLYQHLIQFKKDLRRLLTFNSGWLEASSISSRYSIYLTNSISVNLKDKYSELDKALELFINPKNLSFTDSELVAKYNFPTDNLHEVDMDNW